ncbi:MAG: hypothetical protein GF344_10015, partial [Chitinivibrionales bacterium]|nr:hypothetical protein [Chitinivibrionales bacterium]MBD3357169.1 hypothetical protein [Chitinivibrionales bacterium]
MMVFLKRAAAIALCVMPLQAQSFLGHSIPDSLAMIDGDYTVSGVEIVGGISGGGTLTMTDADTLIVVGDADLSGFTLSDPTAGVIVFGLMEDPAKTELKVECGTLELNHLWFIGSGSQ